MIYSQRLISALEEETKLRVNLYTGYLRYIGEGGNSELLETLLFEKVIKGINFPVIVTDAQGEPIHYNNIAPKDTTRENLLKLVKALDKEMKPVEFSLKMGKDTIFRKVHFGLPRAYKLLQYFPLIQFLFLGVFLILGVMLLFLFFKREEAKVWTALAKETAHQFGTPLSSLLGWIEVIKGKISDSIWKEIKEDVKRIEEVVNRFSLIGKLPKKEKARIDEIIASVANFLRLRAASNIKFSLNLAPSSEIKAEKVLFSWAIENILKNSIDAIGEKEGTIEITGSQKNNYYAIKIKDTGGGIDKRVRKRVFKTGFSTKRHGWGLGLALAKRVIETHHKGKIRFIDVSPGSTTLLITIPLK